MRLCVRSIRLLRLQIIVLRTSFCRFALVARGSAAQSHPMVTATSSIALRRSRPASPTILPLRSMRGASAHQPLGRIASDAAGGGARERYHDYDFRRFRLPDGRDGRSIAHGDRAVLLLRPDRNVRCADIRHRPRGRLGLNGTNRPFAQIIEDRSAHPRATGFFFSGQHVSRPGSGSYVRCGRARGSRARCSPPNLSLEPSH